MSIGMKRRHEVGALVTAAFVLAAITLPLVAIAGPSADSGFEGDDANLVSDGNTDWNSFNPVNWTGTDPYQTGTSTADGWKFFGLTDDKVSNSDTAFSGGTKQDDFCADTRGGKAPNKDDLVRTYLSSKTVGGDVFLALAWARIPQNSITASAHVAFEFNRALTPCGDGSPLVEREPGDALIVYDFQGGDAAPTLKISRWLEAGHPTHVGNCEVGGGPVVGTDADGCWGNTTDLTAFAEAAVNVGQTVTDALPPGGPEDLGFVEFGEAIINLTDAGVFTPGQCLALGSVFAVSRSSGNSANAQMKDLVGPGEINLTNCGQFTIEKQTTPDGSTQSFDFGVNPPAGDANTGGPTSAFSLQDDGSKTILNVQPGTYDVTETIPLGWDLDSVTCTGTDANNTVQDKIVGGVLLGKSLTIAADGDVTCPFNNVAKASLKVAKETNPDASPQDFTFTPSGFNGDVDFVLSDGEDTGSSFANLDPGTYTVTETVPTGWRSPPAIVCTGTDTAPTSSGSGATATFRLDPGDDVTCTFTNTELAKVSIMKTDDATPPAPLVGAEFSVYEDLPPDSLTEPGAEDLAGPVVASCTTAGVLGTCSTDNVLDPDKAYWVVETVTPTGYETADPQRITPSAGENVMLTFVDPRKPATVNITKTTKDASTPEAVDYLGGAGFQLYTSDGDGDFEPGAGDELVAGKACTTADDGTCSITDILPPGEYWVSEDTVPSGYAGDDPQKVTLALDQTVDLTFDNIPLTDVTVMTAPQPGGDVTQSKVVCYAGSDDTGEKLLEDLEYTNADRELEGLLPGQYVCFIDIDP